jgi:hypothetical protein
MRRLKAQTGTVKLAWRFALAGKPQDLHSLCKVETRGTKDHKCGASAKRQAGSMVPLCACSLLISSSPALLVSAPTECYDVFVT